MQLLALASPGGETLTAVTLALNEAGLEVIWSFDLQSAMARGPGCAYSCHGKPLCNCEYMVLLVYGHGGPPASLVIHGHGGRSWVVLSQQPINADLKASIIRILGNDIFSTHG